MHSEARATLARAGTIFAYGQTGSGKTFSMMGGDSHADENRGIVPRLNEEMFQVIHDTATETTKYLVTVSYLEIYNEMIRDLLNPSDKALKVREHPNLGHYVEGLCELIVAKTDDVLKLLEQGNTVRRVAATSMNERSSRSHSIFMIKLERKTLEVSADVHKETSLSAKINLVDLAGSERASKTGATGSTLKEGAAINQALTVLGRVINALAEGPGRSGSLPPYRESKLTLLLKNSLGGNAATIMLAAISPANYNYDETLSTLRYANRAKSIQNAVTRNEDINERMVRELKEEIEKLRLQLQTAGSQLSSTLSEEQNLELEERIRSLQRLQDDSWEERQRLSQQLEQERKNNMTTVISSMLEGVKAQKMELMKSIKRKQNQKQALQQEHRRVKEKVARLKASLEAALSAYQDAQAKLADLPESDTDGRAAIEQEMADLLNAIEQDRSRLLDKREILRTLKSQQEKIDDQLSADRAELVTTHGLLDENEKLRAAIQQEERLKARGAIEAELAAEKQLLEHEREAMKSSVMEEVQDALNHQLLQLRQRLEEKDHEKQEMQILIDDLHREQDDLENKLAECEVKLESAIESQLRRERDLSEAKKQNEELLCKLTAQAKAHESIVNELKSSAEAALTSALADSWQQEARASTARQYDLFRDLMRAFEKEREGFEEQYKDLQRLLNKALGDVLYLTQNVSSHSSMIARTFC
jgi:hypothetical protein